MSINNALFYALTQGIRISIRDTPKVRTTDSRGEASPIVIMRTREGSSVMERSQCVPDHEHNILVKECDIAALQYIDVALHP